MSPADAAVQLCAMAAAECLGRLLVLGWVGEDAPTEDLAPLWSQALGVVLLRWIGLVAVLAVLLAANALPFLQGRPLAALCLAGSALLLSLMHLAVALRRARGAATWLFAVRLLFAAVMIRGLEALSEPTAETLLAALFLLWLLLALVLLRGAPALFGPDHSDATKVDARTAVLGPALMGYGDILIAVCLLPPGPALGYLVLRGAGLAVAMALQPLLTAAATRLRAAGPRGFPAAAARLNLGLMLIGGGLCLAMLTLYEVIPAQMTLLSGAG